MVSTWQEYSPKTHNSRGGEPTHQMKNTDLLCGEVSLPDLMRPMVGPALKEFNQEVTSNRFFVFQFLKDIPINLVIGCLNFVVDITKSILTLEFKVSL